MLLVNKETIEEQVFDSNVIITALEEDRALVTDIMKECNIIGLNYLFLGKSTTVLDDFWYWKASEETLRKANCMILAMTPNFFKKENEIRRHTFWYEVGVMNGHGLLVIPYMINIPHDRWDKYLSKTPIRQTHATGNPEDLMQKIDATRVFRKKFYTDRDVALYGNSRIFYTKLTVLFRITDRTLERIFSRVEQLDDDEISSTEDVISYLQKEINFGTLLYRFGQDLNISHPYYQAYQEEALPLHVDCTPTSAFNRFVVLSHSTDDGVYTVKVDFIIPNHEIFGASFKPYMEIGRNSVLRESDLRDILTDDSGETLCRGKLDICPVTTDKTLRLYFNSYFDKDQIIVPCDSVIGQTCNFVYPK